MSTRKFIDEKLAMNMIEHQKVEKELLKRENQAIRQKDRDRVENLEVLKGKVIEKAEYIQELKVLVDGLTTRLNITKKRYQDQANNHEMNLANLNK